MSPLDPLTNQVIISSGIQGKVGMDICDGCQNSHVSSLVCELRVSPAGKAKEGAKMENQKQ